MEAVDEKLLSTVVRHLSPTSMSFIVKSFNLDVGNLAKHFFIPLGTQRVTKFATSKLNDSTINDNDVGDRCQHKEIVGDSSSPTAPVIDLSARSLKSLAFGYLVFHVEIKAI